MDFFLRILLHVHLLLLISRVG
uniref:Uncharacterized protein n=1 Tax=Arundo donax TaxID=35708 RepID=A0A0A9AUP6_ARUDO